MLLDAVITFSGATPLVLACYILLCDWKKGIWLWKPSWCERVKCQRDTWSLWHSKLFQRKERRGGIIAVLKFWKERRRNVQCTLCTDALAHWEVLLHPPTHSNLEPRKGYFGWKSGPVVKRWTLCPSKERPVLCKHLKAYLGPASIREGPLGTPLITVFNQRGPRWHFVTHGFESERAPVGTPLVTVFNQRGPPLALCGGRFQTRNVRGERRSAKRGVWSVPMRTVPSRRST